MITIIKKKPYSVKPSIADNDADQIPFLFQKGKISEKLQF